MEGEYTLKALPVEAQVSPVFGIMADDLDGDGKMGDMARRQFLCSQTPDRAVRCSKGVLIKAGADRSFTYQPQKRDGHYVKGEVRDAAVIDQDKRKMSFDIARVL